MIATVFRGRVAGNVVILDEDAALPEGAVVEVRLLSDALPEAATQSPAPAPNGAPAAHADRQSLEKAMEALISDDRSVRAQSARALGDLRDSLAAEALLEAMGDRAEEVRHAAEEALLKIGPAALGQLIASLVGNDQMRAAAQKLVGQIDPNWIKSDAARAQIPAITATLKNPHSFYRERETAAKLLGDIGDPCAIDPLIGALQDESRFVRSYAARALGQIGDRRAVRPLLSALVDQEPGVHEAVAEALGMFGQNAVEFLIEALENRHSLIRKGAAEALEQIGDSRALEPLLPLLKDEDARVREAAVEAISQIADERAIEPLMYAVGDESAFVRTHAVQALGQIGDSRASYLLVAALDDSDPQTRRHAAVALQQMTDPTAILPLASHAMKDPMIAEEAVAAVQRLLEVAGEQVTATDLQSVSFVKDVVATGEERDKTGMPVRRSIDCSRIRELAREELKRRGK